MTVQCAATLPRRPPFVAPDAREYLLCHGEHAADTETEAHAADVAAGPATDECSYFEIGPVGVELRSDLPEAAEDFAILYRGMRVSRPAGSRTIRMQVRLAGRTRWGFRCYTIIGDGDEVFRCLRPDEVLPYLEWAINYRVIAECSEYLQLHAATLACAGQGVMLVGQSGCGKSTLAAALAARGWEYLSDEFALIEPGTLLLQAMPKALCVKAGSFDLVRELGLPLWCRRPYVKAFKGRVAYVSPSELNVAAGPRPIRLIVFPRYTGGGGTALYPVSRGRAAFSLASNAFNRNLFGQRLVGMLAEIVRQARCVALEPDALDEACGLLESLLSVDSRSSLAQPALRPQRVTDHRQEHAVR
jgi:HprK-related kinase A